MPAVIHLVCVVAVSTCVAVNLTMAVFISLGSSRLDRSMRRLDVCGPLLVMFAVGFMFGGLVQWIILLGIRMGGDYHQQSLRLDGWSMVLVSPDLSISL